MLFSEREITGRERTHVVQMEQPRFAAHQEAAQAFLEMRIAAQKDGFDLLPFSSFRDYDTQLRIWNQKFRGKKPLYDIEGNPYEYSSLSELQIIDCILNWSALPGGSRHHWGTEIDVIDGAVMPEGYQPKLLPEEVKESGIFYSLHGWLDENIERFGFFRPYKYDRGGMYPEPWHLSYAPISEQAIECLTIELLTEITQESEILGKELVLELMPQIYKNHILNIVRPSEQ